MSLQKGIRKFLPALGFAVLCLSPSAAADDWGAPEPVSFHSRGFGYVAEVFPPRSRQNSAEKPLCYFYEVGYPGGTAWKIDAKLQWKAPLVNDLMPYQAVVSTHGRLVTLNEYAALGYKNAVAIYSQTGALIKTYSLEELIPPGDREKIETSTSSRWWNKDARYYFLDSPARLYVVLPWEKVGEFHLDTGRYKYGLSAQFRELAQVMTKGNNANQETEVWATSLRFSSITDLIETRAKLNVR
jgi:hypothetical protein